MHTRHVHPPTPLRALSAADPEKNLRVDETFDTEAEAKDAAKDYLPKKPRKVRTHAGLTFKTAWGRYRVSLKFKTKKATTQRSEETHVKAALKRFGKWPVSSIEPQDVEAMILAALKEGKAPDTIRNVVAALSAVLRFCVERQILSRNPCIGVPRPPVERKPRRMAAGDEGSLMAAMTHPKLRFRSAARLCLLVRETGARPGEWIATRWPDIDLNGRKVTFPNTKYKNLPRTIPLATAALSLLSAQLEDITIKHDGMFGDSELVFPTWDNDGNAVQLQYSGTLRDMKKAGLLPKHIRAHSGRHEYISELVEDSDLDDSRIMSLVGHYSPVSMQIYTHARNVRYRDQFEALEPKRRGERASSLAQAAGLPKEVIDVYLAHRRKVQDENQLEDALKDLGRAAKNFGSTESDRMQTLMRIRDSRSRKRRPEEHCKTAPRIGKKRIVE